MLFITNNINRYNIIHIYFFELIVYDNFMSLVQVKFINLYLKKVPYDIKILCDFSIDKYDFFDLTSR